MSLKNVARDMIKEFGYTGSFLRYSNSSNDIVNGTVNAGTVTNTPLIVYGYRKDTGESGSSDVRTQKIMALADSNFDGVVPTNSKFVRNNREYDIIDNTIHELNGVAQYVDLHIRG